MKISIRHFPFKWRHTGEEIDDLLAEKCLRAGQETSFDLKSLGGYDEFRIAAKAVSRLWENAEIGQENLSFLHSLAFHAIDCIKLSGGPAAAERCLLALAEYIIRLLHAGPDEYLHEIARTRTDWPCLVTLKDLAKPRIKKRQDESCVLRDWLKSIQLGEACPARDSSNVETNRLAKLMIDTIEENKLRLLQLNEALKLKESDPAEFNRRFKLYDFPEWALKCESLRPLKEGAWKEWFEVGWEALLDATQRHPENYKDLRLIGNYREKVYERKKKKYEVKPRRARENSKRRDTTKTKNSDIRAGIKQKIRESFRRLTND
jgi:hypothetical protein